jgi:hypothetical protein
MQLVPRTLRSAISAFTRVSTRYALRRGALLSRGPYGIGCSVGPGSAEQRKSAAPRPGHVNLDTDI